MQGDPITIDEGGDYEPKYIVLIVLPGNQGQCAVRGRLRAYRLVQQFQCRAVHSRTRYDDSPVYLILTTSVGFRSLGSRGVSDPDRAHRSDHRGLAEGCPCPHRDVAARGRVGGSYARLQVGYRHWRNVYRLLVARRSFGSHDRIEDPLNTG